MNMRTPQLQGKEKEGLLEDEGQTVWLCRQSWLSLKLQFWLRKAWALAEPRKDTSHEKPRSRSMCTFDLHLIQAKQWTLVGQVGSRVLEQQGGREAGRRLA